MIEDELGRALDTFRRGLEGAGLTVKFPTPTPASLGAHRGLQSELTCTGNGIKMRTWIAMPYSSDNVYSLTYTGLGDSYDTYRAAFEKTLQSLDLK